MKSASTTHVSANTLAAAAATPPPCRKQSVSLRDRLREGRRHATCPPVAGRNWKPLRRLSPSTSPSLLPDQLPQQRGGGGGGGPQVPPARGSAIERERRLERLLASLLAARLRQPPARARGRAQGGGGEGEGDAPTAPPPPPAARAGPAPTASEGQPGQRRPGWGVRGRVRPRPPPEEHEATEAAEDRGRAAGAPSRPKENGRRSLIKETNGLGRSRSHFRQQLGEKKPSQNKKPLAGSPAPGDASRSPLPLGGHFPSP